MQIFPLAAILYFALSASAHPGEVEDHDTPDRSEFLHYAKRSIENCREELIASGHVARAIERRAALADSLRSQRGFGRRALADVLKIDHKSNKTGLTTSSPSKDIFTGQLQCVLQPETTEGPYCRRQPVPSSYLRSSFVCIGVKGELIRNNIVETQAGVPLYTDYQFIDVNTCKPIPNIYIESWQGMHQDSPQCFK